MFKSYAKELIAIAVAFGLISYTVYVVAATPTVVVTAPAAKAVLDKKAEPAKKADKAAKPVEVKKEHKKKPTLKKKYADKK